MFYDLTAEQSSVISRTFSREVQITKMDEEMGFVFTQLIDDDELFVDSTSSSSDGEAEQLIDICAAVAGLSDKTKRNTTQNYCEEVVPSYTHKEFIMHFRLSRELANDLTEKFDSSEQYQKLVQSGKSRASIMPNKHILTFLWFAGHQTLSFRDVADRFDVALGSLNAIISRVPEFLSSMAQTIITWPDNELKQMIMDHYQAKGFPGVIGCIDGSHICIDKPTERPIDYYNRKDYYSVNLQGICDNNLKFLEVFIGFPGSVHGAKVFRNSDIAARLPDVCQGGYLLGDSAYPLLPHLITPYRDNGHLTRAQRKFNRNHSLCRVSIKHAFGVLKQRFRQLYHLKLRDPERICHFIRACCVLHNIASQDDLKGFENPVDDDQPVLVNDDGAQGTGTELRDEICRQITQHDCGRQ